MRLKRLDVSGFRGFPGTESFDLDADAIIISGANGSGKTSLFDAFLWALSGSVTRLTDHEDDLVSKYSPSGEARVELHLTADDGSNVKVVRRFDGTTHVTLTNGDQPAISGPAAEAGLIDVLWPDAKTAADPRAALNRSLTRATYLQQDAVSDFVQTDDEQTRFQVVGELVGVGRISELQRQLESSRNAWTRASTTLGRDLEPLTFRAEELRSRLSRLATTSDAAPGEPADVGTWIASAMQYLQWQSSTVRIEESAAGIDRALQELAHAEEVVQAQVLSLRELSGHLESERPHEPDLDAIATNVAVKERGLRSASDQLVAAEQASAARRRAQVELTEQHESRRALAQLALRHLDVNCPVCGQTNDPERTRQRLEGELGEREIERSPTGTSADVVAAAGRVEGIERELSSARQSLLQAQSQHQAAVLWDARLARLADRSGLVTATTDLAEVTAAEASARDVSRTIALLRGAGEQLSLALLKQSELAQHDETEAQLQVLLTQIEQLEATISSRKETTQLASTVIEALRDANDALVTLELKRIEPLLQRIFATVDPHPSLRLVSFLTRTIRGRGNLWTTLDDIAGSVRTQQPAVVLSSSQLNVLAVATYLALNLSIQTLPLQVVALDDPLQSLDTVNLLGLSDLLRRVKSTRQVIVSTHDPRLADLLERKLRPVSEGQRTMRFDLHDWTTSGPTVEMTETTAHTPSLRLVGTA